MKTKEMVEQAQANCRWLKSNPYPGRGIVSGLNEAGTHYIQVYWLMGRRPSSRNRIFGKTPDGRVYTETADGTPPQDPLTIYNAMREKGGSFIVSNGDQTDDVWKHPDRFRLDLALSKRLYEPDKPNFTQRITSVTALWNDSPANIAFSIIRRTDRGECERVFYEREPQPGFGHCITTYETDGNPLPPFLREPLLMPLAGGLAEILATYWEMLNAENRVAIAVKFIDRTMATSRVEVFNKLAAPSLPKAAGLSGYASR